MTMTIFQIPLSSCNAETFEETAADIIYSLNKDNKNINICMPIRGGKTTLLSEIVAFCVRNCLFERITYLAPTTCQCEQFSDFVAKKLHDEDISFTRNTRKIIKTEFSNILAVSFFVTLGGMPAFKNDLLLIDEENHLNVSNYRGLLPFAYESKGIITTSSSVIFNHFPSKDHNK